MLDIDSLVPHQVKRICTRCVFISGALIEPCKKCSIALFFEQPATDDESDAETVVIRKKKGLTEEQLKKKAENREKEMKRRAEKIALIAQRKEEERLNRIKNRLYCIEDSILNKLSPSEKTTFKDYCQNQPKQLEQHNRLYTAEDGKTNQTRGDTRGNRNNPMFAYSKPAGYVGYALEVEEGPEMAKHSRQGAWVVAYHGTPFKNIASILESQLRPGDRQMHSSRMNVNSLSSPGEVGKGIYFSPNPSCAENYGGSGNFYCVLQCRVNPKTVRFASWNQRDYWVVPSGADVIPYRLLFKLT